MSTLIWTFQLVGGEEFQLHTENNRAVQHDGGLSIWHLRLNKLQAQEVQTLAEQSGVTVKAHCATEDDEQTEMHQRYFESEESLFRCARCLDCYWLDLQIDGYCGAETWPPERRQAALESFGAADKDLETCPVRG